MVNIGFDAAVSDDCLRPVIYIFKQIGHRSIDLRVRPSIRYISCLKKLKMLNQ